MTQLAKPATEWSRYAGLPAVDKTVMRLKALIGAATTKTAFFNAMRATETRAPDGKAWSVGALNPILDRLQKKGLLGEDYACVPSLLGSVSFPGKITIFCGPGTMKKLYIPCFCPES